METTAAPAAEPARGRPRILVFANQKGGVGKTTAAVNLARYYARARQHVLMVDTDRQGTARKMAMSVEHFGGPSLIGFDWDERPQQNRDPRIIRALRRQAGLYDLIVADSASALDDMFALLLEVADLVIIPCTPTWAAVEPTITTAARCADAKVSHLVLINRVEVARREGPVAALRQQLARHDVPVLEAVIRSRVAWEQSVVDGVLVADYHGDRSWVAASTDLNAVAGEIMTLLFRMVNR